MSSPTCILIACELKKVLFSKQPSNANLANLPTVRLFITWSRGVLLIACAHARASASNSNNSEFRLFIPLKVLVLWMNYVGFCIVNIYFYIQEVIYIQNWLLKIQKNHCLRPKFWEKLNTRKFVCDRKEQSLYFWGFKRNFTIIGRFWSQFSHKSKRVLDLLCMLELRQYKYHSILQRKKLPFLYCFSSMKMETFCNLIKI